MAGKITAEEMFNFLVERREQMFAARRLDPGSDEEVPQEPFRYDYSDPIIRDRCFVPSACPLERSSEFFLVIGWSETRQEMFEECVGEDALQSERLRESINRYGTHWKNASLFVPVDLGVKNLYPVPFLESFSPGATLRLHELGKTKEFMRMRSAEGETLLSFNIVYDELGEMTVEVPTRPPSVAERGFPVYEGDELLSRYGKPIRSEYRASVVAHRGMCEYVGRLRLTEHFASMRCMLCGSDFWPQSLDASDIRRTGIPRYCADCHDLRSDVWRKIPLDVETRRELALRGLELAAELTGTFPFRNLKRQVIGHLEEEERDRWFMAQVFMPDHSATELFGSWDKMLARSGSVGVRPRKGRGGYVTTSQCGHVCYSIGERSICDFLNRLGIEHEKEPRYPFHDSLNPSGKLRADWLISDLWLELAGYPDDSTYMKKMAQKQELAEVVGLRHFVVMPSDLARLDLLFDSLGFASE